MKRYLPLLFLPAIGCGSGKELPPPAARPVDYATEVRPIFQKHCYSCHGPNKQKGEYRLDVKKVALKPDVITPGDSANSPLIHHLVGTNDRSIMPPDPPPLTPEQIGLIRAWIDQGAAWGE